MRGLSIRWRLTLWYGAALAAVLLVFGVSVYLILQQELRMRRDVELSEELDEILEQIEETRPGQPLAERLARRYAHHETFDFQVEGNGMLFRSDRLAAQPLPTWGDAQPAAPGGRKAKTVSLPNLGRWRVAGRWVATPRGMLTVQAAVSLADDEAELARLLLVFLLAGPLALTAALGGGYWLARKALAPVDKMIAAADEITATELHRRIEEPATDDELRHLAQTLNGMIARLERSFDEIRRFTADAAHELRTPLAVIRSEAEIALRAPRDPERYRQVLENQLEEVERLTRLAEQLLFLCREDARLASHERRPVRLDEVALDVCDHMRVVAEAKAVRLEIPQMPPATVLGDRDQLWRLLFNLVDNAVKFTPAGGTIRVAGQQIGPLVQVRVSDTGPGIPPEHLPHIFERFYRVDPSRSQEAGGTGLGLAICRSIAERHGGGLTMQSTPGRGTEALLSLPVWSTKPEAATNGSRFNADEAHAEETQAAVRIGQAE